MYQDMHMHLLWFAQVRTLHTSPLEMQSPGPAARPDPKFRPDRAFCGVRTKSAGLMSGLGKGSQCIMHWQPGFVRRLEDTERAHQISCSVDLGSGFAFREMFASLIPIFCQCVHKYDIICLNLPNSACPISANVLRQSHVPLNQHALW